MIDYTRPFTQLGLKIAPIGSTNVNIKNKSTKNMPKSIKIIIVSSLIALISLNANAQTNSDVKVIVVPMGADEPDCINTGGNSMVCSQLSGVKFDVKLDPIITVDCTDGNPDVGTQQQYFDFSVLDIPNDTNDVIRITSKMVAGVASMSARISIREDERGEEWDVEVYSQLYDGINFFDLIDNFSSSQGNHFDFASACNAVITNNTQPTSAIVTISGNMWRISLLMRYGATSLTVSGFRFEKVDPV